jgi:hypothetical protein
MKLCTKCKTEKRFIEFHKNKKTIDGINYTCKSCVLEYQRNNKEKRYERGHFSNHIISVPFYSILFRSIQVYYNLFNSY